MSKPTRDLQTQVVRAGELKERIEGAVNLPIFQSSTFEHWGGPGGYDEVRYIRLNNTPNHRVLHAKLAELEGGEDALVTSSGMSAITTSMMTILQQGDHLLVQNSLYGGTHGFVTETLPRIGIQYSWIDAGDPASWAGELRPNTRAFYVEAITNPLMEVGDLKGVAEFCREKGLVSMIDSTFASPVNFRPLEIGFDLSLHSATKYLNGHHDIVAGAVIGKKHRIEAIRHSLNHLGGALDPHACFLLHRGIKTLALRVACHNDNGLQVARFLASHPRVQRVYYPGLESHPAHSRAAQLFSGFGGMLSFELAGGMEETDRFLRSLSIPIVAPSLGGVETLVTRPAVTSHVGLDPEERRKLGISDELVRMSVGIESARDLIDDLRNAIQVGFGEAEV